MDPPAVPLKRDPRQEIELLKAFCLDKLPIEDEAKLIVAFDCYYNEHGAEAPRESFEILDAHELCPPQDKDT